VPFIHQNSLGEHSFPVRYLNIVLQVLPILVPKLGWLALLPVMLIEGELRLYQRAGGFWLAHPPVSVFPVAEVQWRLRG
jgi:hypothetical protein